MANDRSITAGDVQDLAVAVEQLTEETRLLRISLDELRDDVVWAARQVLASGYQVSEAPLAEACDPLAPDGHRDRHAPITEQASADDEMVEGSYCCDSPKLAWNGDPTAPGIACENCGYIVAELGQVAIWRPDDDSAHDSPQPPTSPDQRQGTLFD